MIGSKSSPEILELFEHYRRLNPRRISLNRFMVFTGIGSELSHADSKRKLRGQVDRLISAQAEALGIERKEFRKNNSIEDVYYWPLGRPALFQSRPAPVKVTHDPSLATWTPSKFKAAKEKERKEKDASWQLARKLEADAERAAVRNLRVKKEKSSA